MNYTILYGVRIGAPSWSEEVLTEDPAKIEEAQAWATANGFDRFRVSRITETDFQTPPDFTACLKV